MADIVVRIVGAIASVSIATTSIAVTVQQTVVVGGSGTDFGALPEADAGDVVPNEVLVPFQESEDGPVVRGSPFMFASRRTKDLAPYGSLIGTELLPFVSANGLVEGSAEAKELQRLFTGGVINPKLYGAKGGSKKQKYITADPASTTIVGSIPMFTADDIGKIILLSNVGTSGYAHKTTISAFVDSRHVIIAQAPPGGPFAYCEGVWGWDDTAAIQAAQDAAAAPGQNDFGGVVLFPADQFLTSSLVYRNGSALVGQGRNVTKLRMLYKPENVNTGTGEHYPLLSNGDYFQKDGNSGDDWRIGIQFPFILNLGLDVCKYHQVTGSAYATGLQWNGAVGYQGDPQPYFQGLLIEYASYRGLVTNGRHSGTVTSVDVQFANFEGWKNSSYDVNGANILCIGNGHAGYADGETAYNLPAANCNIMNLKLSYNGGGGYNAKTACNMLCLGAGNNYSNLRLQECPGSSLVLGATDDGVGGAQWNKFGDLGIDDTGCVAYPALAGHGSADRDTKGLDFRAMIMFSGATVVDNHITVAYGGGAVHPSLTFASHGIYADGDCSHNSANLTTRQSTTWFNPDHTSGDYVPQAYLNKSSGGTGSNRFTINGALQS